MRLIFFCNTLACIRNHKERIERVLSSRHSYRAAPRRVLHTIFNHVEQRFRRPIQITFYAKPLRHIDEKRLLPQLR